jgi:hypothetical protein
MVHIHIGTLFAKFTQTVVFMNFTFIFDNILQFVRRRYVYEHIKYVWCIYNQVTGSFQPEKYVEVMDEARHVDFI